jgi:DNA-binding GntR family transcriptional regulator
MKGEGVLTMDAYDFIRNAIIEGDYEPGQRLTEESLATELHLSRTPVREAIKRLETEGLVTSLKRGVSVRTFNKEDIRQIYDLRALLEGYAASQAAMFRTKQNIDEMALIHALYTQTIERIDKSQSMNDKEIVRLNNKFHELVLQASKNEHIRFLISKVIVIPLVFRSFYWYDKQEMIRSSNDHQTILEAIQNQDPDRAKTAMLEHIYKGRDHVLRHLSQNSETLKHEESV